MLSGALEMKVYEKQKAGNRVPANVQRAEDLEVAHIFKRSVTVYSSNSSNDKDKDKVWFPLVFRHENGILIRTTVPLSVSHIRNPATLLSTE